jgi:hypothetical protein
VTQVTKFWVISVAFHLLVQLRFQSAVCLCADDDSRRQAGGAVTGRLPTETKLRGRSGNVDAVRRPMRRESGQDAALQHTEKTKWPSGQVDGAGSNDFPVKNDWHKDKLLIAPRQASMKDGEAGATAVSDPGN